MKYLIPVERIEKVNKFINTINRKGGDAHIEIGTEREHVMDSNGYFHACLPVYVDGFYKVGDWTFAAAIEHTPESNIIRSASDKLAIPKKYRTIGPACEHCGKIRNRKDTYLVYNSANDEFKQVGKTCLKDYTGLDADRCALLASFVDTMEEASDLNSEWAGIKVSNEYPKKRFNCACIKVVLKHGYDRIATPDLVLDTLLDKTFKEPYGDQIESLYNIIDEYDVGTNPSDYEHNASVAWKMPYKSMKHVNLVASWVSSNLKRIEREKAMKINSEKYAYVGNVGDKVEFEVEEARVLYQMAPYSYNGSYTDVYRILGKDGNIYKWATNTNVKPGMKIKATIKALQEYKGEKQNVVTRGKVISEVTNPSYLDVKSALDMLYED